MCRNDLHYTYAMISNRERDGEREKKEDISIYICTHIEYTKYLLNVLYDESSSAHYPLPILLTRFFYHQW